ncbi:hotdog fold thioesterase [Colwellia sp. 20A7]|uniref:hotdog fold thioesterase n=1 Tax=Colwellia sp. 20A7 TaxID=2689569 RepID=UPI003FA47006
MPADKRTHQPYKRVHGGANVVLAETLASVGSLLTLNPVEYFCVGQEVNANHLRGLQLASLRVEQSKSTVVKPPRFGK